MLVSWIGVIVALVSRTVAHGGIWNYSIAGDWRPGYFPYYPAEGQASIQRHWTDFKPITNVSSPSLICNDPGTPAEEVATIAAGAEIQAYYRGWPHVVGPIIIWMAYCGPEQTSCAAYEGIGRDWFKVHQTGLMEGPVMDGLWAQKEMMVNRNNTWGVTIPRGLKGGAYLMRHELVALHVPFTPEFYPECAHLWVVGDGEEVPGEEFLVSIPGVWKEDEPELHLSIYEEPAKSRTEWTIPGPAVWRGSE